jgi:hypothetical protein
MMTKVGRSDGEATFAGTRGNDKVAPKPAVRLSWVERVKPTHSGHSVSHASGLEVGLARACSVTLIVVECRPGWNLKKQSVFQQSSSGH